MTRCGCFALTLLFAACGSSDPDPGSAIEGSFVAANPWPSTQGFYIAFSLNTIGETVSGQGWLGGVGDPLLPITIVGQFTDPEFALGISSGAQSWGTITGSTATNGLQGMYQMVPGSSPGVPLTFARQDSGSVGRYSGTTTGEFSGSVAAAAGFTVQQGNFFFRLAYPNRSQALLDLVRQGPRPGVGTHGLGESTIPGNVVMGTGPNLRYFRVKSGQMRVDVSTPYALIGELLLQAEEAETRAGVGLSATFSAGCSGQVCQ